MNKTSISITTLVIIIVGLCCLQKGIAAVPCEWIFKTKGDYFNLVSVWLTPDKKQIIEFSEGPTIDKLDKGYLSMTGGDFYPEQAIFTFTDITWDEWRNARKAGQFPNLLGRVIDYNPFEELYICCRAPLTLDEAHIKAIIENNEPQVAQKIIEDEKYNMLINGGGLEKTCDKIIESGKMIFKGPKDLISRPVYIRQIQIILQLIAIISLIFFVVYSIKWFCFRRRKMIDMARRAKRIVIIAIIIWLACALVYGILSFMFTKI